jgi:hypothetical protein
MPRKILPPLPDTVGESEHNRFKRSAVPKSEITPAVEAPGKLEAKEPGSNFKISDVRRRLGQRRPRK